jgi:hypothetical protein
VEIFRHVRHVTSDWNHIYPELDTLALVLLVFNGEKDVRPLPNSN